MRSLLSAGLVMTIGLTPAWAVYLRPDLVDVPVDRIVANLESRLAQAPRDATLHHALARAHAIAYAQGVSSLELFRPCFECPEPKPPPDERQLARESSPPELRPYKPVDLDVPHRHLRQALEHYREAIRLDPEDLAASLGYGWTLDQSGDQVGAREHYRALLRRAIWLKRYDMAREIGSYLTALLSPFAQAVELAELKKTLADVDRRIRENPRPVTPLVIPLDANASFDDLVDRDAAVPFDLDGSGLLHHWQWITPRAGWLVYQGTGERGVDSGTRLIGSRTFWIFWSDGYAAMAALDDDGDGRLAGDELAGLAIWRDANSNGAVETGEVRPVSEWGIVALSCAHVAHPQGFPYSPRGAVFADGSLRPTYDWIASSARAKRRR